jgi:hypothetical protein
MRFLTSPHTKRISGPRKFRSSPQKNFCNDIRQRWPYNELAPLDSRGWRRKKAATEHADIKIAIAIMFTGSKKFSAAIAIASLLCLWREVIWPF